MPLFIAPRVSELSSGEMSACCCTEQTERGAQKLRGAGKLGGVEAEGVEADGGYGS